MQSSNYQPEQRMGTLNKIEEWDRRDVKTLKCLLDAAWDHPEICTKDVFRLLFGKNLVKKWTAGVSTDIIKHPAIIAGDILIAMDTSGRGLLACSENYSEYFVKDYGRNHAKQ